MSDRIDLRDDEVRDLFTKLPVTDYRRVVPRGCPTEREWLLGDAVVLTLSVADDVDRWRLRTKRADDGEWAE